MLVFWIGYIAISAGSMPERFDFDSSNVFHLWSEVVIILYMLLLMHRSIRVIRGKPFYLMLNEQRIYFRYELLKKFTTTYILVLMPFYLVLPQANG